jgi:hypothetical protein
MRIEEEDCCCDTESNFLLGLGINSLAFGQGVTIRSLFFDSCAYIVYPAPKFNAAFLISFTFYPFAPASK